MKELSVFIDESGDFGEVKERPAYYFYRKRETDAWFPLLFDWIFGGCALSRISFDPKGA